MSLFKSWDLQIDSSVLKTLQKIPRDNAENILKAIRLLPVNPYFGDIQKMKGEEDTWRRRIGSYRIFYKIKNEDKVILNDGHQKLTNSIVLKYNRRNV